MLALLANPDSGSGEAGNVERLLNEAGVAVSRFDLDHADEAAAADPERVVVAGGDGSIGPAAEVAASAAVPLGVVPVGTANDFARALGLPREPERATRLAATGSRTRALDLGRAGSRPFVNAVSAGLSPVAARRASGLKRALGPLAYTAGAVRAGLTSEPVEVRVTVDDSVLFEGAAWQAIAGVSGAFGGGAQVGTEPDHGCVDAVVVEAGSRARLVVHGFRMRTGGLEGSTGVLSARGRQVEIETDGSTGFNVDGEIVDIACLGCTIEPRRFELVVGP